MASPTSRKPLRHAERATSPAIAREAEPPVNRRGGYYPPAFHSLWYAPLRTVQLHKGAGSLDPLCERGTTKPPLFKGEAEQFLFLVLFHKSFAAAVLLVNIVDVLVASAGKGNEDGARLMLLCVSDGISHSMGGFDGRDDALIS